MPQEDKTQPKLSDPNKTVSGSEPPAEERTAPRGRQAFRSVVREMTDVELNSPAAVKLLLDMLDQAESARDEYKSYVERYHEADKRADLAEEKRRGKKILEICFGLGAAFGGILAGAAQPFWSRVPPETVTGNTLFGIGVAMIIIFGALLLFRK